MKLEIIKWLKDLSKKDVAIAGGKGANLAELYNFGMPVPPAFVVTAQAYKYFLKEAKIKEKIFSLLNSIELENTAELEEKSREIQQLIVEADMPLFIATAIKEAYKKMDDGFVAVRSSATTEDLSIASFAGQQETYLNVKGEEALIESIKKCWASLFTARAIYYRAKRGFSHENALIAVIVQRMVDSEKSGVIFTIEPLENDSSKVVIEAVFGLGEGIVSGTIEPDNYVIDKATLAVIKKRIGKKKVYFFRNEKGETVKTELKEELQEKQVLDENELRELANLALKIEQHYKWPQDIEWAIEKGRAYIVQSRPVTTVKKKEEKVKIEKKEVLSGLGASPGIASGKVKIVHKLEDLAKIKSGDVLVTRMTNPDMVVTMQKASAIVTDEGGLTCHAAIVAREVGIPCVVGARKATQLLKEDSLITVDGTNGKVYEGKIELPLSTAKLKPGAGAIITSEGMMIPASVRTAFEEAKEARKKEKKIGGIEKIEKIGKILVKVNCDLPESAERAAATGADGVGLVRIEFIIAKSGIHPAQYIKEGKAQDYAIMLANGIERIAKAFYNKPVWVRTSDIRTDEYRNLKGAENEPHEENPMLGWHGIRRGLAQPEILKAEFTAIKILHERGYKNVGVMLPFLISVDELKKAKEICREAGLEPCKDVEFGVMIETPAACMIIEELCKEGINFISFGTNDLTQLTLGIDRNNERLAPLYDEMHPAVLSLIEKVIETCKKYNVKTSICGQAGSRPEMAIFLAKQGISSISANIDAVHLIKETLSNLH